MFLSSLERGFGPATDPIPVHRNSQTRALLRLHVKKK
jgi:hypothetical protein